MRARNVWCWGLVCMLGWALPGTAQATNCNGNSYDDDIDIATTLLKSCLAFDTDTPPNVDPSAWDHFGFSVDIDGDYAIVGAPYWEGASGTDRGAAFIFKKDGGSWVEMAILEAWVPASGDWTLGDSDHFGFSVAISGDLAVVGAPFQDLTADGYTFRDRGAMYVYRRNGNSWEQEAALGSTEEIPANCEADSLQENELLGWSVDIYDGEVDIVAGGAPRGEYPNPPTDAYSFSGAVYVYRYNSLTSAWEDGAGLAGEDGGYYLGTSVAVGDDVVVAGAPGYPDSDGKESGAVMVYTWDSAWGLSATLTPGDASAHMEFGSSVAYAEISSEMYVLVGAPWDGQLGDKAGAAYLFYKPSAGSWGEQRKLRASDGAEGDLFGADVDFTSDHIVIGAPGVGSSNQGATYVWVDNGETWADAGTLSFPAIANYDWFGSSVAVSNGVAISGAFGAVYDSTDDDAGTALIYQLPTSADCNGDSIPDECDVAPLCDAGEPGFPAVCLDDDDANLIPDECEDCDENGESDSWEIAADSDLDCDDDGILDECQTFPDCNTNDIPDSCDIAEETSDDLDGNGIPDECEDDCNDNDIPDLLDMQNCAENDPDCQDCNANGILDVCDIDDCVPGFFYPWCKDDNSDDIPDGCQDCDGNGVPDPSEIDSETTDLDDNGVLDVCEDCNGNGIWDYCDLNTGGDCAGFTAAGESSDINTDGVPDECQGLPHEDDWVTSPYATAADFLGYSVAVHGDWAIAGSIGDSYEPSNNGTAVIFAADRADADNDGVFWEYADRVYSSDGVANGKFGYSVAMSENLAVIGAPGNTGRVAGTGAVYVYRLASGSWVFDAKLQASDGAAGDFFGSSVAVYEDDTRQVIVVGTPFDDDRGTWAGSAYVFRYANSTWTQEAYLDAGLDAAADDMFGSAVAVSLDTIIVGAPHDDDTEAGSGSAYVFHYDSDDSPVWSPWEKLVAKDPDGGANFGASVALLRNLALVGAPGDDDVGAAYVCRNYGPVESTDYTKPWAEQIKLTAESGSSGDSFGSSVSLSGTAALVTAPGRASWQGAAYVFRYAADAWSEESVLTASTGATGDSFGWGAAMDADNVLVAAPFDNVGAEVYAGSVYAYLVPEPPPHVRVWFLSGPEGPKGSGTETVTFRFVGGPPSDEETVYLKWNRSDLVLDQYYNQVPATEDAYGCGVYTADLHIEPGVWTAYSVKYKNPGEEEDAWSRSQSVYVERAAEFNPSYVNPKKIWTHNPRAWYSTDIINAIADSGQFTHVKIKLRYGGMHDTEYLGQGDSWGDNDLSEDLNLAKAALDVCSARGLKVVWERNLWTTWSEEDYERASDWFRPGFYAEFLDALADEVQAIVDYTPNPGNDPDGFNFDANEVISAVDCEVYARPPMHYVVTGRLSPVLYMALEDAMTRGVAASTAGEAGISHPAGAIGQPLHGNHLYRVLGDEDMTRKTFWDNPAERHFAIDFPYEVTGVWPQPSPERKNHPYFTIVDMLQRSYFWDGLQGFTDSVHSMWVYTYHGSTCTRGDEGCDDDVYFTPENHPLSRDETIMSDAAAEFFGD